MKLNRIKAVLLEKGISQTWLAKKLDKSFSMVNAYACNRIQPNLESRENAVWSLLLASGYVKLKSYTLKEGKIKCELVLTNQEVHVMFEVMIEDWFAEFTPAYNAFFKALFRVDLY